MRWIMGVAMLAVSQMGLADGLATMKSFLNGLNSFKSEFEQSVIQGKKKETSRGKLTLQRPGRFRWDYEHPYPHLVLADGFHVWVYDPDLEQITRQKQASAVEGTPAQLLTNDVPIEKNFVMKNAAKKDGLVWVELKPKDSESQYEMIRVGFKGKNLNRFEIMDKFGQHTRIVFKKIKRNPKLAWDYFVFEPPEGADLIEQ